MIKKSWKMNAMVNEYFNEGAEHKGHVHRGVLSVVDFNWKPRFDKKTVCVFSFVHSMVMMMFLASIHHWTRSMLVSTAG